MCIHLVRLTDDKTQAFNILARYCEANTDENCGLRISRFFIGKGGDKSAALIWQKSCNGGYPRGCRALGWSCEIGKGVPQNHIKAAALYQQACDGDDAGGCSNLGLMHRKGRGVTQTDIKAVFYYQKACDAGNTRGCSIFGVGYKDAKSAPKEIITGRSTITR